MFLKTYNCSVFHILSLYVNECILAKKQEENEEISYTFKLKLPAKFLWTELALIKVFNRVNLSYNKTQKLYFISLCVHVWWHHCDSPIEPNVAVNVELKPASPFKLNLTWESPSDPNGVITGYRITWRITTDDKDMRVNNSDTKTEVINKGDAVSFLIDALSKCFLVSCLYLALLDICRTVDGVMHNLAALLV